MAGKRAGEAAGKSEVNQVPVKVEEKVAENEWRISERTSYSQRSFDLYLQRLFFRAAFAPFLPRAVRVFLGKCAIVLFPRAALAAFLIFRFAAVRCFLVVMISRRWNCLTGSSAVRRSPLHLKVGAFASAPLFLRRPNATAQSVASPRASRVSTMPVLMLIDGSRV